MDIAIPERLEDLTPGFLTKVVNTIHRDVTVESFELLEVKTYGRDNVSTSDRLKMALTYGPGVPAELPTQVAVKLRRSVRKPAPELYANEVSFYVRMRPELPIRTPVPLGGVCDKATGLYYLILEDLMVRNARFPTALDPVSVEEVCALLKQLAILHAAYWDSPRLRDDLSWYQAHVNGSLHDFFAETLPVVIAADVAINAYKRECIATLNTDLGELGSGLAALQAHQATLSQTVLHGDAHIGNAYLMPDGGGGLLDFQLTARGYCMHDVNYLIVTALTTEERRRHERDLLRYYLDALARHGAGKPPSFEDAWVEYRRGILWSFYVGWLTTPIVNYGEAINRTNLQRITAAFADHGTKRLVDAIR